MSSLTDSERVLLRARSLMINRGYGWSKAIARAAELTEDDNADSNATDGRRAAARGSRDAQVLGPRVHPDE